MIAMVRHFGAPVMEAQGNSARSRPLSGAWLRAVVAAVDEGTTVLGLPEESGVLVEGRTLTAIGREPTTRVLESVPLAVGSSVQLPG